jgi:hypothetical protein
LVVLRVGGFVVGFRPFDVAELDWPADLRRFAGIALAEHQNILVGLPLPFDLSSFSSFFEMVRRAATQRRQAVDRTTPALMQTCRQRAPSARSHTIRASSGFSIRSQSKHSSIRLMAAALGITRIGRSGV